MKRKIGIISTLIVMILLVILVILLTNKKEKKPLDIAIEDSGIAYYYQNGSGYTQGTSSTWTTGYVLNVGKSSCNNVTNPKDILNWDSVNKTVLMSADKNNNCKLYFDKAYTAEEFFTTFTEVGNNGVLLQHTTSLSNSAGDNGYRYSGNNPNNFICFGPGSENYNKGVLNETCPDGNLYRIIGYVPVTLSGGQTEFRVKVIKSEYATKEDLEKESSDGTQSFYSTYKELKRVKAENRIDGFYWDEGRKNIWGSGSLYKALNDTSNSYLHKLNEWSDKIEQVQWNVGGSNKNQPPNAKEVYDDEWNESYGAQTKVSAKIGLMYPSDYGFASEPKSWEYSLYKYNDSKDDETENNQNRENNWLFNAIDEWTISRGSGSTSDAFGVTKYGHVGYNYIVGYDVHDANGVRPVFYLNSSVTLSKGNEIDGSSDHPYRVN